MPDISITSLPACISPIPKIRMNSVGQFLQEIKSIGDIKSNNSNIARLQLWVTGVDFSLEEAVFGYGGDKIKEEFQSFY